MTPFIGLLFFLSGAIGLGYQIVWIKILSLHFGNSAWSISAVVAAFMMGLGLGSWQAVRLGARWPNSLRVYAVLEIGIAAFGLLSLPLFENVDLFLKPLYAFLQNHFILFVLGRLLMALAILIVPTFLMGASLPVLIAALTKKGGFDRLVGLLYGINTLGAAVGTLLAGFILLPHLGIRSTIYVLAAGGLAVGLLAWYMPGQKTSSNSPLKLAAETPSPVRIPLAIILAAFTSGLIGIFYEVSWSRLLAPIVGSSTYAFSIILITFLAGIGLGSLWVARGGFNSRSIRAYIGVLISLTALSAAAGLFVINHLPDLFLGLVGLIKGRMVLFFVVQSILAGTLMLLPTLFMGVTLPLCMVSLKEVGRVYAVNTIGAILGSLLAGFVFLPMVGVRLSILIVSAVGLVVGLMILWQAPYFPARKKRVIALGFGAAALAVYFFNPSLRVKDLQRGSFRSVLARQNNVKDQNLFLLSVRDGITSTVTVFRSPDATWLNVNGKTDASTSSDLGSQYLLGHLPLFLMPSAKSACVIGFGSGATVNAVASHPLEKIDVVELEPAVIETAPYFTGINDNVLADPRVKIHLEDGRTFLKYNRDVYDVIISEPSNPWIIGIGALFTTEFYHSVKKRLSPNGVFCQWIQDYEMSNETRNVMLATLADEFHYVQIITQRSDLIVIASNRPIHFDPRTGNELFKRDAVKRTLNRISVNDPFDLFLGYLASFPQDRMLYDTPHRNTDDNHWLEFRAPLEMYQGTKPSFWPLPGAVLFDRVCQLFFPDKPRNQVAVGLAGSLAKLRPYATNRAADLLPFVSSAGEKKRIGDFVQAMDKRFRLETDLADKLAATAVLLDQGKYQEVLSALQGAAALDVKNPAIYRQRGEALFHLGRVKEARASYRHALECYPEDYISLVGYGVASLIETRHKEGAASLRDAIRLVPQYTVARTNLAVHLSATKQLEQLDQLTADSKKNLPPDQFKEYLQSLQRKPV